MFESNTFQSSDHLRYEHGVHISGPHNGGAPRVLEIRENTEGTADNWIFIFIILTGTNLELQMTPKELNVVRETYRIYTIPTVFQVQLQADNTLSIHIDKAPSQNI